MGLRDLGLAQPLQQRRITSGSCDCLHLGAMCACVRHSHVRVCVRDGVFVSGMRVLFADLRGERERGSHINTFLQGQTHAAPTDSSVRPRVLSLASSQTAEQREIWKAVRRLTSPRAETLTSSPGRAEITRGDNRERGNCTSESPAGSDTPSTNQLTSKRSHGAWQPGRSLIANLQNLTVVLPWEGTPSRQWGLENRPEDWKWMLSFAIDVSYLLLDNAT